MNSGVRQSRIVLPELFVKLFFQWFTLGFLEVGVSLQVTKAPTRGAHGFDGKNDDDDGNFIKVSLLSTVKELMNTHEKLGTQLQSIVVSQRLDAASAYKDEAEQFWVHMQCTAAAQNSFATLAIGPLVVDSFTTCQIGL
eukprot:3960700-Amphidinium_carterae.1